MNSITSSTSYNQIKLTHIKQTQHSTKHIISITIVHMWSEGRTAAAEAIQTLNKKYMSTSHLESCALTVENYILGTLDTINLRTHTYIHNMNNTTHSTPGTITIR